MIKHIFTIIWNKRKKNFLLFLEIFFSFLILFAVFTFAVANFRAYQTPLGFNTENIWLVETSIDQEADSAQIAATNTRLLQELKALPEIEAVSFSNEITPFSGSAWQTGGDDNGFEIFTRVLLIDEFYAETMGMKLVEGRWFNEDDKNAKHVPVVISKQFREESFQGRPVLDSLFTLGDDDFGVDVYNKIVGVVDHYKYNGEFEKEVNATLIYQPYTSKDATSILLRLQPGVTTFFEEKVSKLIASITKRNDFSIQDLDTKRQRKSRNIWVPIIALLSISGFLIINVALGLFGVLWYNTSKRKAEIGLRRTMGASKNNISLQFIGEILMITFIGILAGTFFAIQFPLLKLFDTENINYYYAMLLASLVIFLLVLICAYYPSRQASLINPATALHEE